MKRIAVLAALALAACASTETEVTRLAPADAATTLIVGQAAQLTQSARASRDGQDSVVNLELRFFDGRAAVFQEANHTPMDIAAQADGGPLSQIMGLPEGAEARLFRLQDGAAAGNFCAPSGPQFLGVSEAADGSVKIVALKEGFQFDTRADGTFDPLPASPQIVCSRMTFRKF
ncbi:MAG: hypothetical protein ABW199_11395 [Caulobacterales bacterium]